MSNEPDGLDVILFKEHLGKDYVLGKPVDDGGIWYRAIRKSGLFGSTVGELICFNGRRSITSADNAALSRFRAVGEAYDQMYGGHTMVIPKSQ